MYTQRLIFVFLRLFITLVYSHLVLGFLFMVPERSICGDSLLECFVLEFFVVVVCFFCLFFCFILCSRREYRTPNGSTACLPSAFVLKGFLTSQPKNTQALLLPQGKIHTGNSLIERKPACTPSR